MLTLDERLVRHTQPPSRVGRILRVVIPVATLGYLVWLITDNWGSLDRAVLRIGRVSGMWLVAAAAIEITAQIAGGLLLHRLLIGAGHRLSARAAVKLYMAQNAIGMIVPGGAYTANAFTFRHLRRRGVDTPAIAWVLAGATVLSTLGVAVIGIVAISGPDVASMVTLIVFLLLAFTLAATVRRPELSRRPARLLIKVSRFGRRRDESVDDRADRLVASLGAVQLSNRDWLIVVLFAVVSVAADCAALLCATHALIRLPARCAAAVLPARTAQQCARFVTPSVSRILLVYLAGQSTLALPLIAGGLGPVEAAMTATFVAGHIRPVAALSAVLLYRLVSYWIVLVVGMICWARIRRGRPDTMRSRASPA